MDRLEAGIRLAAELVEAFNRRSPRAVESLLAEDFVLEPSRGAKSLGKAEAVLLLEKRFAVHPEGTLAVEELIGLGPRCILRWAYTTGDGEGAGRVERGIVVLRTREGLVCEALAYRKETPQ